MGEWLHPDQGLPMPTQDPISDQIIRPSQAKSHSEWLTLAYKSVAPDLLKLALHATRCPEEAEDIVQEVFLYALQNERSRPAGISMDEWLLQRLADRLTKRNLQKEPASYGAEYAETIPTRRWEPVTQMQEAELNEQLRSAIEILPQSYREVVLLGVQGGRNSLEIGAILGRPATTVRSQLARGLDRLRRALPPTLGIFALFGTEGSANAEPLGNSLALSKMRDRCIERSAQWAPTAAAPWAVTPSLAWKCAAILIVSVASMMLWSSLASESKSHATHVAAMSPEVLEPAATEEPTLAPIAPDSLRETPADAPKSSGSMELAQVTAQVVGPDGSALPGVEVQLFTWDEWDTTGEIPELMGQDRFGWTTLTDELGRFEFEAPLPGKRNPVVSIQAGMGFTQQNVYFNSTHSNRPPLRTGPNELGVIRLEHAGRVAGVLLDEYGAPAFPAEVILSPGTGTGSMIATRPDGSFEANHILTGSQKLSFHFQQQIRVHKQVRIEAGQTLELNELSLPPVMPLEVIVQDRGGVPIPDVLVRNNPMRGSPDLGIGEMGRTTDAAGRVTIHHANMPKYGIVLSHSEYATPKPYYTIPQGQSELRVTMHRTWNQAFRAVSAVNGELLPNVELQRVVRIKNQWMNRGPLVVKPNDLNQGACISSHKGEWVRVSSQGYQGRVLNPRDFNGSAIDVRLHPLKTIRCQFLDGGEPLIGAEVELLAGLLDPAFPAHQRHLLKDDDLALWMRTDRNGRVEWTAFSNPDYHYRLLARSTKNTAVEHWFTLQDAAGPVVDLGELALTTSGSLRARVLTPDGMTPAGLTLLFDNVQSTVMGQCDTNGEFTLHGLPPGPHRLFLAEHAGFRPFAGPFPFEVFPDATTNLQVDLRPFALNDSKLRLMHGGLPLTQHKVFLLPDPSGPKDKAMQKDMGYLGMTDGEGRVQGERPPYEWVQVWAVSTSTPMVKWKGTGRVQLTGNGDPSVSVQMKQAP